MKILWFSCGVTSAVACKLAIDKYGKENCHIAYIKINSAHPDNERFIKICERLYGIKINTYQNEKYKDQFDVIIARKFINSPFGAPCTLELKKKVRQKIECDINYDGQIFGFEFEKKDENTYLISQKCIEDEIKLIKFIHENPNPKFDLKSFVNIKNGLAVSFLIVIFAIGKKKLNPVIWI
jgi:uncharacterized protein YuzE